MLSDVTRSSTSSLGRREQLLVHQVHAAQHALSRHGLAPACTGSFPRFATIGSVLCPTCMKTVPTAGWSEEHAPIQKGSATMGAAVTSTITCASCNNEPGKTYEKNASANQFHPPIGVHLPGTTCDVHGPARVEHRGSGLFVVRDELPFVRTDFKAGYLLAFAALGYTWAAGPGLNSVRASIAPSAGGPPDRRHGYLASIELEGSPYAHGNMVINVVAPVRCVIVRAATSVSVILPAPGRDTAPSSIDGDFTGQFFPWPRTAFVQGRDIDQVHRAGHLFHLDFCNAAHLASP